MGRGNTRFCIAIAVAIPAVLSLSSLALRAQGTARPALSPGYKFIETGGAELFANVCQGCHMADGRGATGAGTYPSLVADKNLEAAGYPLTIVVNGQRGMPALGYMLSNEQVAAVVNYLRTHFGNDYRDAVTAEDVKQVRR